MSVEVLAPAEPTLAELADTANRGHGRIQRSIESVLETALEVGESLLAAKARIPRGQWSAWLDSNFVCGSGLTARRYMRVATYRAQLEREQVPSLNAACALLADLPHANAIAAQARADEAQEMLASGMPQAEVARSMGVNRNTIAAWTSEAKRTAHARSQREWRARRRQERDALRREQARRTARATGGAFAELYSMAERMQDVLAQAHRETEDRAARSALSEAGVHYRKMRDEIVRALGVS